MATIILNTKMLFTVVVAATLLPAVVSGQSPESAARAADISNKYRIVANTTYLTANNWEAKLDVYAPREVTSPNPTLIYIHGGGWVGGAKELPGYSYYRISKRVGL